MKKDMRVLKGLSASRCLAGISQGPASQAFTKEMRTKERAWGGGEMGQDFGNLTGNRVQ